MQKNTITIGIPYVMSIKMYTYKISPIRDWRSTPTECQLQSHV